MEEISSGLPAPPSYPGLLWRNIWGRKAEFFGSLLLSIGTGVFTVYLQYRAGLLERKHLLDSIMTASEPVLIVIALFAVIEVYRAARSLHREAQAEIEELKLRAHGTKLSLPTETAEDRYWNAKYQAEVPELARKMLTGYAGSDDSEPKPYLVVDYVGEWNNYINSSDEEEYTVLDEFLKFTNPTASGEIIRKIQVAPFTIWGVEVRVETVPTLIHGEPQQKKVREVAELLRKAHTGLRAFHKPVGVQLMVTYYGQSDQQHLGRHALVYEKGNIRVEPLIDGAEVDWLDATEIVLPQDEADD